MAGKVIGNCIVLSSELYERKDGTKGYRVVAFYDETQPCVFYRDAEKEPEIKRGDKYDMILRFDGNLKPVIRFERLGVNAYEKQK